MGVRVKICGLTLAADAALAVRHGASFLGAVFAASARQVSAAQARELVGAAGPVPVFGVFATTPPEEILRLRDQAGLAGAQLHGDYSVAVRARLRQEGLLVWSVAHLSRVADTDELPALAIAADAVLVEPRVAGMAGGSGTPLSVELAHAARERLAAGFLALAGGLTPETVAATIALVRPDIVDVSSGVEREGERGRKDAARLIRFMEVVGDTNAGG